jgi:translation initiation factor 1 (eIF-1/SUI1)
MCAACVCGGAVVDTEVVNTERRKLWTRIQEFQKKVEQHETLAQHLQDKETALATKGERRPVSVSFGGVWCACGH